MSDLLKAQYLGELVTSPACLISPGGEGSGQHHLTQGCHETQAPEQHEHVVQLHVVGLVVVAWNKFNVLG